MYSNGGADDDRTKHGPFDGERELAISKMETKALFRCTQKLEFFHSLSITSIISRLHGVLNVDKKIINYTV
jgi:hypothetical protein